MRLSAIGGSLDRSVALSRVGHSPFAEEEKTSAFASFLFKKNLRYEILEQKEAKLAKLGFFEAFCKKLPSGPLCWNPSHGYLRNSLFSWRISWGKNHLLARQTLTVLEDANADRPTHHRPGNVIR